MGNGDSDERNIGVLLAMVGMAGLFAYRVLNNSQVMTSSYPNYSQ